ncbi:hypothetical protein GGI15_003456 [Coemansia interrupta]|uniref:Uncharacterized protein n=1 Tax=Coemansia interrupta TaxID=1126814 RepID=A0A9W8H9H1_9FUNG|nr:hypothetical protein GGI15_003456 [Coemansia interrupta]
MTSSAAAKEVVLPPLGHAISGAGSSALALLLIYPLDTIKTRQQVETRSSKDSGDDDDEDQKDSAANTLRRIVRNEGVGGLYAGLATNLANQVVNGFVYFYAYSIVRRFALRTVSKNGRSLSTGVELAVGALAGVFNQLLTLPVGVVATRQQTAAVDERQGWVSTVRGIVADEGVRGLWAGFRPAMLLCSNPAITYGVFEKAKAAVLRRSGRAQMTAGEAFWVGALAKTLATVVTYPYIMAKVRLQWRPSRQEMEKRGGAAVYTSSADVLRRVLQSEGISGWFRGMQTQIVKAVITQALMLMIKESFTRQVARAFALSRKRAGGID